MLKNTFWYQSSYTKHYNDIKHCNEYHRIF